MRNNPPQFSGIKKDRSDVNGTKEEGVVGFSSD
jgi:hypothetical protein